MILVTGSEGLIGHLLIRELRDLGFNTRPFDLKRSPNEDVCNPEALVQSVEDVSGIVHLAAISRVVWAQNDPELCYSTNVQSIETLVRASLSSPTSPWLISASSREVYGQATKLPVHEDSEQRPMNTYARSKVMGEKIIAQARESGVIANICRFSNVYGSVNDHDDRVVNAFARAAAYGGNLRLDGRTNTFDFTFVDEVVDGLVRLIVATKAGECFPPIHFVSGEPTSLAELAKVAQDNAQFPLAVREEVPRSFDVASFFGDPERAKTLLGWQARTSIETGFKTLVDRHRRARLRPPQKSEQQG